MIEDFADANISGGMVSMRRDNGPMNITTDFMNGHGSPSLDLKKQMLAQQRGSDASKNEEATVIGGLTKPAMRR